MPVTQQSEQPLSRRDFMDLAWKGLLLLSGLFGVGVLARFLDHSNEPPRQTEFDLGPAEKYPPGSRTPIPEAQAVLIRTAGGFRALSSECPHLGCTVDVTAAGFTCRCHGSQFDPQGALLRGPATSPLQVLRVEQAPNGHLILHTG